MKSASKERGRRRCNNTDARHKSEKWLETGRRTLDQTAMVKLLGRNDPPSDALMYLLSPASRFAELIRETSFPDIKMMETVIRTIEKALQAQHCPVCMNKLLSMVNKTPFFPLVVLSSLRGQRPHTIPSSAIDMLCKLCSIMETSLRQVHVPSTSYEHVSVILSRLSIFIQNNEYNVQLPNLIKHIQILRNAHGCFREKVMDGPFALSHVGRRHGDEGEDPPDDFRNISIVPTQEDIVTNVKAYLRKNLVEGSYRDVDHYLDIQFRLLREDFVQPLRSGVLKLSQSSSPNLSDKHLQDVRVYRGVFFHGLVCDKKKGVLRRIQFSAARLKGVHWESTKRLMCGALVCLSSDHFQTVMIGTVASRDSSARREGIVDIYLESTPYVDVNPYEEYEMVECSAYFEAYRYNLEGLQEMNSANIPFQNYLLNQNTNCKVAPPLYLTKMRNMFNFTPILRNPNQEKMANILDKSSWPTAQELGLDESQYHALQTALTTEFSCIQGPPGTGKTFIGLKIVNLLLHNARQNAGPILIVCYTNHALDQFLEGILNMIEFRCGDIIRVGGGSSSTDNKLKECLLYQIRKNRSKCMPKYLKANEISVLQQMDQICDSLDHEMAILNVIKQGILHENALFHVMLPTHAKSFYTQKINHTSHMCYWLSGTHEGLDKLTCNSNLWKEDEARFDDDAADQDDRRTEDIPVDGEPLYQNVTTEVIIEEEMNKEDRERMIWDEEDSERRLVGNIEKRPLELLDPYYKDLISIMLKDLDQKQQKGKDNVILGEDWEKVLPSKAKLKRIFKQQLNMSTCMSLEKEHDVQDIWDLKLDERWELYRLWLSRLYVDQMMKSRYTVDAYEELVKQLNEVRSDMDCHLLANAQVVAMTTTGAAKYRNILKNVKPQITIVEEAAEVLEAHIVTSLTTGCEHLILIGDHQQLKPNPTVYKLARDFDLNVSLFERMVQNSMHCEQLLVQHRMRPEIVKLIVPHVYELLRNHESVLNYENVKGVQGNIIFLQHTHEESRRPDSKSHSNCHEAMFLVAFARYLIQQTYTAEQITILTTYSGQMFEVRKRIKVIKELKNIRVTTVDSYQGEENDIVLLSLVRSNQDGKIGFLSIPNRVCVALSRAKVGFYAIGNVQQLRDASDLWKGILEMQDVAGCVTEALRLCCQNHPEEMVDAKTANDFQNAPEGGCMKDCQYTLQCGHQCALKCHPRDPKHLEYACRKPCLKTYEECPVGHRCEKMCYKKCGQCPVLVEKELTPCGHVQEVPCCVSPKNAVCRAQCMKTYIDCPSGHRCNKLCSEECGQCPVLVQKELTLCGHIQEIACSVSPKEALCKAPCTKMLPCFHLCPNVCGVPCVSVCMKPCLKKLMCGHLCTNTCGEPCLTQSGCKFKVERNLPCGHRITTVCADAMLELHCPIQVTKLLECGHTAELQCSVAPEQCQCEVLVPVKLCDRGCKNKIPCFSCKDLKRPSCQKLIRKTCVVNPTHKCQVKCGEYDDKLCAVPCDQKLQCDHICKGTCGTCALGSHKTCKESCLKKRGVPCKHLYTGVCGEPWPPCQQPCEYLCGHDTCKLQCGQPCQPCMMKCLCACIHSNCTRECYKECDRRPCDIACQEKLPCCHQCPGFCGEPCPKACMTCNADFYQSLKRSLGISSELSEDKFVLLMPCHHVIPASYMDKLSADVLAKESYPFGCPLCRKIIYLCPRYKATIRRSMEKLDQIKLQINKENYPKDKLMKAPASCKEKGEASRKMGQMPKPILDLTYVEAKSVSKTQKKTKKIDRIDQRDHHGVRFSNAAAHGQFSGHDAYQPPIRSTRLKSYEAPGRGHVTRSDPHVYNIDRMGPYEYDNVHGWFSDPQAYQTHAHNTRMKHPETPERGHVARREPRQYGQEDIARHFDSLRLTPRRASKSKEK